MSTNVHTHQNVSDDQFDGDRANRTAGHSAFDFASQGLVPSQPQRQHGLSEIFATQRYKTERKQCVRWVSTQLDLHLKSLLATAS